MKTKKWFIKTLLIAALSFIAVSSYAQNPTDDTPGDPGSSAFSVYTVQHMNFGTFASGATGGSVIVSPTGSRSTTGSVVGLNFGSIPVSAIFEVEAPHGTIVSILNGPNVTLSGSNGGSVTLTIGNSSPASPLSTTAVPPTRTQINVGGTLTIGSTASSPPGAYTGNFFITFNHE
jgi:hypothetical protein